MYEPKEEEQFWIDELEFDHKPAKFYCPKK